MRSLRIGRSVAATIFLASFGISAQAAAPSLRPGGTQVDGPYYVLSGSMHDHSYDSDGRAVTEDIAAWEYANRFALGIDFGGFAEHSDAFPLGGDSIAIDQTTNQLPELVWPHQAQVDALYTGGPGGFTLMRGFEYTDDQENHLAVIGSQNWIVPGIYNNKPETMFPFYKWISTAPTVDAAGTGLGYGGNDGMGQFNHPDLKGALNWDDYKYDAAAAPYMKTIEIFGNQSYPGGLNQSDGGWYWFALSQGWNLGPTEDWDNHYWTQLFAQPNPGSTCGQTNYLPCERTLVFATENSKAGILDALRNRRTGATQFPGLYASLHTPSGVWMGSTIVAPPGSKVALTIDTASQIHTLTSVDIVSDNGVNPFPYYYGDNLSCNNFPIPYGGDLNPNCLPEEIGETSLAPSYILQHEKYELTNGHATKKAIVDTPPPNTTLATYALSGHASSMTINMTVPTAPSTRPDGSHFFYAVVHASDGSRAWSAPIFLATGAAASSSSLLNRKR